MKDDEPVLPVRVVTTEFRHLPCSLTTEELASEGVELAQLITTLDEAQAIEQQRRRAYDELMETGHDTVREYTAALASGSRLLAVECSVEQNYETGEVTVIRLDVGSIIEHRQMTEPERHRELVAEDDETPPMTVQ